jgi:tRNA threonylcarbamoyl adenosine modification protein (Sua5/YciO/YrdC/YwlC family)
MPRTLAAHDPDAVDEAAAVLARGGAVVLPTETVYGVAASPRVPGATDRLFALKDRPDSVPLAVLVDGIGQADEVGRLEGISRFLAERHWPGPLTLVVPRRPAAAGFELGGSPADVGVRCPDDDLVRSIARLAGPIATTSANRHGLPTPASAPEAAASLAGEVDLVVDGGPRTGVPSTVVDCTGPALKVLREGGVAVAESRVFDRIADRYDETRGGLERGRSYAGALAPWISGRRLLEVGVGTGVVATGLAELGVPPVGVDLSIEMLRRAVGRLGAIVAQADASALPVGAGSVDTVVMVWVLHVVGDPAAALAEAARVLRPGGRLVVIEAGAAERSDDDVARTVGDLQDRLRGRRQAFDRDATIALVTASGFDLVEHTTTPAEDYAETPGEAADRLEQKVYSALWDVPPGVWEREVEPVIAALRALPDPDRRRDRTSRHHLIVFDRG